MEFFSKLTQNKKLLWAVCGGAAALITVIAVVIILLTGGNGSINGCTIEIKSQGGMAMENIDVYVYTDASKSELVSFARTDKNGIASIKETIPVGSVAILSGVPAGYNTKETYPITESATKITLSITLLSEMTELKPGSVMFDFTVTDTDGNSHTLSQLLKEKKAVVLNLWYTNCQPCKMEFPYLQQAYSQYSDSIALLAIDPDAADDAAAIAAYKAAHALTFPMIKGDGKWNNVVSNIAYPTTIIIDRYGMVGLIHTGSIPDVKIFTDAFAYFTADNYVQTVAESVHDLASKAESSGEGTAEKPLEFAGVTQFEVIVEAGKTVYCNLYRVSGMELRVVSENLKITLGGVEYTPADGAVSLTIPFSTDPNTPALVAFTNTGDTSATYQVALSAPAGSADNPMELQLGALTAQLAQGNAQGMHYTYTATETGVFTVTVQNGDNTAAFGIALNNLTTSTYRTLDEDGKEDSQSNAKTLSVDVKSGDKIQLIVSAVPGTDNTYPAISVKLRTAIVTEAGNGDSGMGSGSGNGGGSGAGGGNSGSGTNGKLVNPDDPIIQAMETFDTESIGAGEMKLYAIRGIGTTTFKIKDNDAYIIYNDKTYTPENGVISITIKRDDANVPTLLKIGNSGSGAKVFTVSFYYPAGTQSNPNKYKLNETVTTNVQKGNDQGVYYTYTASSAGKLTIQIESCTTGVDCGITVTTKTGATIQETIASPDGDSVSIDLSAGQTVEIIISTLPDARNNYPKATIKTSATFE